MTRRIHGRSTGVRSFQLFSLFGVAGGLFTDDALGCLTQILIEIIA